MRPARRRVQTAQIHPGGVAQRPPAVRDVVSLGIENADAECLQHPGTAVG